MYSGPFNLLFSDPEGFAVRLLLLGFAFLVGLSVHEFGHAFMAYRLGDTTAQRRGRLTLNPRAHLDPAGTLMLALVGFGWGKPVPVNPRFFRNGRPGMAMVGFAGPAANILLAVLFAVPFQLGLVDLPSSALRLSSGVEVWLSWLFYYALALNVVLAVFNLLPFSPLDGSQILTGLAPRRWLPYVLKVQVYGPMVLIGMVMADIFLGLGIIGSVIGPVVNWATTFLTG